MKHNRNAAAFTLIEVLAALAILSISLVILIKSQTMSIGNVRRVAAYEEAVRITENQLHWTFIDLGQAEDWEEYRDITVEDRDYRCTITLEEADQESDGTLDATLLRIRAVTTWPEGRRGGTYALETWYLWGQNQ